MVFQCGSRFTSGRFQAHGLKIRVPAVQIRLRASFLPDIKQFCDGNAPCRIRDVQAGLALIGIAVQMQGRPAPGLPVVMIGNADRRQELIIAAGQGFVTGQQVFAGAADARQQSGTGRA